MAREEPSRMPVIIVGCLAFSMLVGIVWQEFRYRSLEADNEKLVREVSTQSVEARQNEASLELAAHAYQTEAEQLRSQLATATADRPLDHLTGYGEQDLELCRQAMRKIYVTRVLPASGKTCSTGKPEPALQAAWKAIGRDAGDWIEFHRTRIPSFAPGCFEKLPIDPAASRADNDISEYPDLPALEASYCMPSPDRNLCLYLDYPTGQPDSSARLWDLKNQRELWKSDCGTPCHWDYAAWLDANTAVIVGMTESAFSGLPIWVPEIRVVQLKDRQVSITGAWRGPEVDVSAAGGAASYAEQHKKWLTLKGKSRAQ